MGEFSKIVDIGNEDLEVLLELDEALLNLFWVVFRLEAVVILIIVVISPSAMYCLFVISSSSSSFRLLSECGARRGRRPRMLVLPIYQSLNFRRVERNLTV